MVADSERHHPQYPAEEIRRQIRRRVDTGRLAPAGAYGKAGQAPQGLARGTGPGRPGSGLRHALWPTGRGGRFGPAQGQGLPASADSAPDPQFSASTTGSALDGVFQPLLRTRNLPELRYIRNFHDHPAYIGALAAQVRDFWSQEGRPGPSYRLLISFHGLPRRSLDQGDPYYCECQKTARLLRESLELAPEQVEVCFQSRFGRAQWLQPYTAPTLEKLAKAKVERVDVICPGFVSDCLETLEEIGMEGKATFLAAGGKTFHYIPCLNERPDWIAALGALVLEHLQGWPQALGDKDTLAATALRAKLQGAPQ